MSVKVVTSGSDPIKVSVETIPAIKVTAPEASVISVNPNYTTGQPGAAGPEGPQGPAGADGAGVPSGGDEYQVLRKGNGDITEWAFADRVFIAARFSEAVSEGDPVYVSGFHGSNGPVIVSKADASDSSKMPAIGLATQDYSQNNEGDVACIGSLKDVDTDSFSVGDVLYVASGGGLTNVKPTGTNLIQNVGKVGRSNQNNGEIVVMAIGRSNDVPNIPDGQAWIGNSSGVATPTTLADVATSGAYSDLTGTPTINNNVTTDITISRGTDTVTVESSDGTDGIIEEATGSKAGVMTVAMHDKLDGIDANADVTDSTSVGNAGAVMDADFSSQGLMHRNASSGSYAVFTGGQGIELDGINSEVKVNVDSEINAYNSTDDVVVKITGPSGVEDDGITLRPSGPITIEPATNVITFTVDDNLANYTNNAGFLTSSSLTTHTFEASGSSSQIVLTSVGADGTSDTVTIDAGANISFSSPTAAGFTITSTGGSGGAEELNELDDVSITGGLATNDYLVYDGANFTDQSLDISHDDSPTLGGDLVVNGNKIKATGAGQHVLIETDTNNIKLNAAGEIDLTVGSGNHINAKGDLDMSGNDIVTTQSNLDITLTPHGTGQINLGTYPIKADDTAPDSGDNLKVLTYVDDDSEIRLVSNPQGTVTTTGTQSSTQIAAFTANTDELTGFDTFTIDGSGFKTPNVLVKYEQSVLTSPGRYGPGSRVTRTMFTDANANKTAGDVYVMNSSSSVWTDKADADAVSTASGLLAVAGSTSSASGMVLSGIVRMADNTNFANADRGDILYLDTDAGHVTATKPTGSGKVVRIVGYLVYGGTQAGNDGIIYFDPSKDWIELSS